MPEGPPAGRSLRELTAEDRGGLLGERPHEPRFPLLTKYIDPTRALPVHLHADDATARRLEGEPNGKTEAWHVLDAVTGATALVGVRPGADRERLRRALLAQDFDTVMRRLPVRAGQTVYVPGGTLHSFGPGTLVHETCPGGWRTAHRWPSGSGRRTSSGCWTSGDRSPGRSSIPV
ncbi:class I mannose-6-phosphate isomerase [Streptomyces flaveolus]|uniref:class I mannose-6-phosphate isomerase n=1 Tax=Streptomyces flaveolus TaxID=67297 RepID=UPI0033B55F65